MSENLYFYNKTKSEYVQGYGNGNRADSLRHNFPILLAWLLMNDWIYDQVHCVGFKHMSYIISAKDRTNYYIDKFNSDVGKGLSNSAKEHGELARNKYAKK